MADILSAASHLQASYDGIQILDMQPGCSTCADIDRLFAHLQAELQSISERWEASLAKFMRFLRWPSKSTARMGAAELALQLETGQMHVTRAR